MAITREQKIPTSSSSAYSGDASSLAVTFSSTTTTSNAIICGAGAYQTPSAPSLTISDNGTHSWTYATNGLTSGNPYVRHQIGYVLDITGRASHQITITPGSSSDLQMGCVELSGVKDFEEKNEASSGSGPGAVTSLEGDYCFARMDVANDVSGLSWTGSTALHGGDWDDQAEKIVTTGGSESPTWSTARDEEYSGIVRFSPEEPQFVDSTNDGYLGTGNITITLPTYEAGDLVVIAINSNHDDLTCGDDFEWATEQATGSGWYTRIAYKIMAGTEGSSTLFTTTDSSGYSDKSFTLSIRGIDPTTPYGNDVTHNTTTSSTVTFTGLTTDGDNAALVAVVTAYSTNSYSSWSSPLTEREDTENSAIAFGVQASQGASGNKTATGASSVDYEAFLLSFNAPIEAAAAVLPPGMAALRSTRRVAPFRRRR